MARNGAASTSTSAGWTISAACTPANAPRSSSRILPPPLSSAGVPMTDTVSPTSSATRAAASPAPTALAAIRLWPQACPMRGRQSYSAQNARWSGPLPARATNAVGRPPSPRSTAKPAAASASHSHVAARSSSKASSGLAWMRWLNAIRRSRSPSRRSRAAALASMGGLLGRARAGRNSAPQPEVEQHERSRARARDLVRLAGLDDHAHPWRERVGAPVDADHAAARLDDEHLVHVGVRVGGGHLARREPRLGELHEVGERAVAQQHALADRRVGGAGPVAGGGEPNPLQNTPPRSRVPAARARVEAGPAPRGPWWVTGG